MNSRLVRIALACLAALVLAAGIAAYQVRSERQSQTASRFDMIGGPFELVDQDGKTVTRDSFAGRFVLMSFGFTFCPDVCPTELSQMAATMDLLGDEAERLQPVFVTVDPERDTPEAIGQYVRQFHPRLIGLTGTPEQIATAAGAYKVYYSKVEQDGGYYTMDHSTFLYLLGPDGTTVDIFPYGTDPEDLAARIREHMSA
jgi:protein SCO1/2